MADSSASLLLPKQIDDLGLALISLARELWVTKDRQIVLESMLQKKGLIDDVAALQPDDALVAKLAEERTRFIEGLSAILMRSATPQ